MLPAANLPSHPTNNATPHAVTHQTIQLIRSLSNEALNNYLTPTTEKVTAELVAEVTDLLRYGLEFEAFWAEHDHLGVVPDLDAKLIRKIMAELGRKTPKQRLERFLSVAQDGGWQAKHLAWRKAVHQKFNYTCQHCGRRDELQAHHLKPRAEFPELEFVVENGLTLCYQCHKAEHKRLLLAKVDALAADEIADEENA